MSALAMRLGSPGTFAGRRMRCRALRVEVVAVRLARVPDVRLGVVKVQPGLLLSV